MIKLAFILLLLVGLAQRSIYRNKCISPFLAISLAIYIICWNAFPFLYSTFLRGRTHNIISNSTYQKVVVIQFISVVSILMLLNFLAKYRFETQKLPCPQRKEANGNKILVLLTIIFIFSLIANIYSINTAGLTFLKRVQYAVSESNKENAIGALLSALNSFSIPFAIACFFYGIHTTRNNKWIMRLSVGIITIHIGFMVIFGMRSYIFLPIVLIVIFWKVYTPKLRRTAKVALAALMLTLIFAAPYLSRIIQTIRGIESYRIEDIFTISSSEYFSSVGEYVMNTLDDIYVKFNSFEHGTALLEVEGASRVGMSLITSALTSPIPRILYPEKPVAFSSNGEYSGVPYYLVPSLEGVVSLGNVVPVPPSTIAIWEIGYTGLILMIAFNVVNLLFINYFMKSELLLHRTIGFFMLAMPTFEYLVAPTGLIVKEAIRIIVLILFIKILLFMGGSKRKVIKIQNLTASPKPFTARTLR